jgi:hypothetical protein
VITPGQAIPIEDDVREGLGIEISQAIDDTESNNSLLFRDVETHWKWYEATPASPGPKNFPFRGASNIVVPLIQIMVDTFVNRAYAAIFAQRDRVWAVSTEREDQDKQVKDVGRWLNWAANNNDFSIRLPAYDQMLEMAVVGSSVMALNWRQDVRWAYVGGRAGRKLQVQQVRYARGAFPEHIPREQILWDTNHLIQDAPMVVRELRTPWSHLRNKAELDPETYNMENIMLIQGQGGAGQSPSQRVRDAKNKEDARQINLKTAHEEHDIREVHLEWPMLDALGFKGDKVPRPGTEREDTPSPPIVVTLDRKSRKIIRLIAEPYYFPYKPFFDIFYRKRSGRGHSAGIAKKLEHMQRSMTTSLNQAHDARTRANAVWAKTKRKDYLNKPLDPSTMIYDPDMNSVEAFNLGPQSTFDDMRIMTAVNTIAERQTGMSDPAMGRETRQGGHPSPATSTLALLDQSEIMQGTTRELIRSQYSRLGEAIASLYQQFETNADGKLQRVLGVEDAKRVETFLFPTDPISGTLMFDVAAMSGSNTPDAEMKRAILISQMNTNYWISVVQGVQMLESQQVGPMVKKAILEGIRAGTKAHLKFLEAGDVDDLERYVLSLAEQNNASGDDLRTASNRAQEIAGGNLGPGQQGVGGPPGVVPGGAPSPFGSLGGLG